MRLRIIMFSGIHLIASSSAQAYAKATSVSCEVSGYASVTSESDCKTCIGQASDLTVTNMASPASLGTVDHPFGCYYAEVQLAGATVNGWVYNSVARNPLTVYDCATGGFECCCQTIPATTSPPTSSPSTPSPTPLYYLTAPSSPSSPPSPSPTMQPTYAYVDSRVEELMAIIIGAAAGSAALFAMCLLMNHLCFLYPRSQGRGWAWIHGFIDRDRNIIP